MEAKKGVNSRYATLLARDVLPVQTAHLKESFELAPARRIYHTPEAVDNYLRLFDRVLLRYYRVLVSAMMRITGHSAGLLEEHLALVEKHFPDEESLVSYVNSRGIKLEKSS